MRAHEFVTELFEPGKKWQWSFTGSEEAFAEFHVGDVHYMFHAWGADGEWEAEFKRHGSKLDRIQKFGLTGTGNSAEVMSTVVDIMRAFLSKYKDRINVLTFSAKEDSRQALYAKMVKRLLPDWTMQQKDEFFTLFAPKQDVTEAFNKPYPLTWEKSEYGDVDALATLEDGTHLSIMFEHTTPYEVAVSFWRNNSQEVTGEGDAQRIFATVLSAIQQFLKQEKPANITFSAVKADDPSGSRSKLYTKLVQRYAGAWGYQSSSFDHGDQVTYELTRLKQGVGENFADGKVKGKSRPGRVKRAGASCDGSVTDLRQKAKNASGERAKMYHWCANMKSGKSKK
jgi:hypothetical protein